MMSTDIWLHGHQKIEVKRYGEGITIKFTDGKSFFTLTFFEKATLNALKRALINFMPEDAD